MAHGLLITLYCQHWLHEYIAKLVEAGYVAESAIEVAATPPKVFPSKQMRADVFFYEDEPQVAHDLEEDQACRV